MARLLPQIGLAHCCKTAVAVAAAIVDSGQNHVLDLSNVTFDNLLSNIESLSNTCDEMGQY